MNFSKFYGISSTDIEAVWDEKCTYRVTFCFEGFVFTVTLMLSNTFI